MGQIMTFECLEIEGLCDFLFNNNIDITQYGLHTICPCG